MYEALNILKFLSVNFLEGYGYCYVLNEAA